MLRLMYSKEDLFVFITHSVMCLLQKKNEFYVSLHVVDKYSSLMFTSHLLNCSNFNSLGGVKGFRHSVGL